MRQRNHFYPALIALVLITLAMLLLSGCTTTREITQTRIDTLTVYVPGQLDTVTITQHDSVWAGESTKYILRVDTLVKRAYVYAKPETLYVPHIDTVTVISAQEPEPWYVRVKSTLYAVGFVTLAAVAFYLFVIRPRS